MRRLTPPRLAGLALGLCAGMVPLPVAAHALHGRVDSPLPLAAYLLGAAAAVALSFMVVALGEAGADREHTSGRLRTLPPWARVLLRLTGLLAWSWVVIQTLLGGSSDAEVASLILWVYGWVGLPIVSALAGPVWPWLDPFTSLHDIGAWVAGRLGRREEGLPRPLPARLGVWPAVAFMGFFVWLELAVRVTGGPTLGAVLIGYTLVTLAGMAAFGRDAWRSQAEVFGVWLGLLGRLAPYALEGPSETGHVRRQPFGRRLVDEPWSAALLTLVALAAASVIYGGLSQTEPFFDLFGVPAVGMESLILAGFVGAVCLLVLGVARRVGLPAMGAGLVPVALGYLVAHYFTQLLIEGQRIVVALSDPFQLGWDLLGTAFWEPREDWLPTTLGWSLQVGAVVIGHVAGAWLGHQAIRREQRAGRPVSHLPLALIMIGLTALTLWSLGQNLAFEAGPPAGIAGLSRGA
ncbi:hypothetical protein BH23CHL8_BH23CHL8_01130 [soil metagenome]